ncbi:MAG: hypothetical protein L0H71_09310 [Yaniella sp.]|nr:hypothetical protein [Yaniella sp.]
MEQFIKEIRAAVDGGAWILALAGMLALPDICAAIESPNGKTSGQKYRAWVERWLSKKYPMVDPADLYKMRCSFLHEGEIRSSSGHPIVFTGTDPNHLFHNNLVNGAINLDLPTFCNDLTAAVGLWQAEKVNDPTYQDNVKKLIQWHPQGRAPYISEIPVLS